MTGLITTISPRGFRITVGMLSKDEKGIHFLKEVKRSKHFMRMVSGYGIQKDVFDKYLRGKEGHITIFETDAGNYLKAPIATWAEHGSHQNYGFGTQVFLSEKYMEVV